MLVVLVVWGLLVWGLEGLVPAVVLVIALIPVLPAWVVICVTGIVVFIIVIVVATIAVVAVVAAIHVIPNVIVVDIVAWLFIHSILIVLIVIPVKLLLLLLLLLLVDYLLIILRQYPINFRIIILQFPILNSFRSILINQLKRSLNLIIKYIFSNNFNHLIKILVTHTTFFLDIKFHKNLSQTRIIHLDISHQFTKTCFYFFLCLWVHSIECFIITDLFLEARDIVISCT